MNNPQNKIITQKDKKVFKYKSILALVLFMLQLHAFGQNVEFTKDNFKNDKDGLKEAIRQIKTGDDFVGEGFTYYYQALEPYLAAQKFNPNNALLNFRIGLCYLYSSYKFKSLPYFEKAKQLNSAVDPALSYYLGRGLHLNEKWERAIEEYKNYQKSLNLKNDKEKVADTQKKIQECLNGIELVKNPIRVFIDNVGREINSPFSDYGPVITADETVMMFTSRRSTTTGGKKDEKENKYFEDIYISEKKNGKWTEARNMGKPINTEGHDATVNLTPDGQRLLIYLEDGDIYVCDQKGEMWSKPNRLDKQINSKYHESSASLTYDQKELYFVSNRPDGMGDRDIYKVAIDDKGKVSKLENLGPTINTQYGEEGVFMHPDGKTMYFSSQGHKSMGGYDVFKSTLVNGKWSEPENMGYPINTPDDDVFMVLNASGRRAYYSSFAEDGFGEKDIYVITILGPEKPYVMNGEDNLLASQIAPITERVIAAQVEIKTAQITILKGIVVDALTKKPLEALIELVDNVKNEVVASFTSNSKTGRYLVTLPSGKNYGIAVKADNYLFHSENFDIPTAAGYQEIVKDFELKNIAVGSKIVLRNIFFDFDKFDLRSESTAELERLTKLLNDVPSMKIEISGHTDSKGSASYNQKLSENRAKSVVDYLIAHGISKGRLEFAGYGLTQPIATNDTDEGRQLNRRTEFKILSK